MKNYILILITVFLLTACNNKQKVSLFDNNTEILSLSSMKNLYSINCNDSNFFASCHLIQPELTDNSIIWQVTQVELFENRLFILDQKSSKLFVFDSHGNYIMSVGSKGNGPGEYLATSTFFINHYTNSINILDPVKLALHIYDLDGNYIESMMFNELFVAHIKGVVMLDKETIVCFTNPNFHMESGYFIVNLSNLSVKTTIYKYPLKITGHISFAIAEHPYSVFNNEIHFVIPFSNSVNCHGNHSTNMLYNIINGREEINTEQLLKFADQYNNDYIDIIKNCVKDDKYSVGFKNYYETDRYICVDYYIKGMLSQALLYDKKHKESYIIDDYSTFTPDFGSIINSSRNTLIKVWKNDQIIGFKQNLDNGNISKTQYSPDILQLVENYTEDDNPVIILYQMNN